MCELHHGLNISR